MKICNMLFKWAQENLMKIGMVLSRYLKDKLPRSNQ